jgi:hypothetical protein
MGNLIVHVLVAEHISVGIKNSRLAGVGDRGHIPWIEQLVSFFKEVRFFVPDQASGNPDPMVE